MIARAGSDIAPVARAGNWDAVYRLEASADLIEWEEAGVLTNVAGVTSVRLSRSKAMQFFRAVRQ